MPGRSATIGARGALPRCAAVPSKGDHGLAAVLSVEDGLLPADDQRGNGKLHGPGERNTLEMPRLASGLAALMRAKGYNSASWSGRNDCSV